MQMLRFIAATCRLSDLRFSDLYSPSGLRDLMRKEKNGLESFAESLFWFE